MMSDIRLLDRLWLLVYVAIACASCASMSAAPVPKAFSTPHNANFIDDAYAHPDVWDGAAIATQAQVRLIRATPNGRALSGLARVPQHATRADGSQECLHSSAG
jgi:hypothetical protein